LVFALERAIKESQVDINNIEFNFHLGTQISFDFLEKCSNLFSNHYGRYSEESGRNPGQRVKLSRSKISELFINETTETYTAEHDEELIGYVLICRKKIKDFGVLSWVTQLVVHENYRKIGVAKRLLTQAWSQTNDGAWGILSVNPYAIRALEASTKRRCQPSIISKNKELLLRTGRKYLPFLKAVTNPQSLITEKYSRIFTDFPVDQSKISKKIDDVTSNGVPWLLGGLKLGYEWFAFTFKDQDQSIMTEKEVKELILSSEKSTKRAYARMSLDDNHKWHLKAQEEVEFIVHNCGLKDGASILDLGCGDGRHSIELSTRHYTVTGLDYNQELIDMAIANANEKNLDNLIFKVADSRMVDMGKQYDVVLCLYDVIGTYIEDSDNQQILECISKHLKPSGFALISVMNYEHTLHNAKNFFSYQNLASNYNKLKPSSTMESSGDIHNPDCYFLDKETKLVIRKEQFRSGHKLPEELTIFDRRYEKAEIKAMCQSAGLEVEWANYMSVGKWSTSEKLQAVNAKEILILCRKI